MSGWRECKLGDVGKVLTGKTPSRDNPEDWGDEILFITPSDYGLYGKNARKSIRMLSAIGANRQSNRLLPPNSVLVTCIGSDMGKSVMNALPCVTNQQINAIIPDLSVSTNDFLYYITLSLYDTLRSLGGDGTAVPILNKSDFENIDILLPPLPEQKAIAGVLSSLDDKIDLLHRQNKTLEGMAEALWRKMFVVEADLKWPLDILDNLFDIGIGRTPPRKEQHWFTVKPSDVKWISIKDMGNCGVYIDSVAEYLTKEAVEKFHVPIIPINTDLLSFKMTVGRLAITTEDMISNEAIAHFKIKDQSVLNSEFLYFFLKNYSFENLGSTSSIVEAINSQMIKEMEMLVPPKELLIDFRNIVAPYFLKIKTNQQQIRSLSKMRDDLLSKLMCGEVRVKL